MPARSTDWRTLVVKADPDHNRDSRYVVEYEFSRPGSPSASNNSEDERTLVAGRRVFKGDYTIRGAYGEQD